nr:hypothetical protein [Treponema sp.]
IYNFGQDIGGFAGPRPSKELFIRWIQYGIFTPRFVLHSWNPDGSSNMPWLYEDLIPTVKKLFDLRQSFIPYLYNQFYRSYMDYRPVIYPVFLKYPDYDVESDAFFFGDNILACPVFNQGAASVCLNLPDDEEGWYLGCKICRGKIEVPCGLDDMPVYFVKAGSIIPRQNDEGREVLEVYPLENGSFNFEYFMDDGKSRLSEKKYEIAKIQVICSVKVVKLKVLSGKKFEFKLFDHLDRKLEIE